MKLTDYPYFDEWQAEVQSTFAIPIYKQFWPDCEVHENDTLFNKETTAQILDFGDVDKIIFLPGKQIHLAQRFRKPFNGGVDPDFTLRYSRPTSDQTIEYERLFNAYETPGASYPRRYSFGRVYPDHTKGLYELHIIDTDVIIEGIQNGELDENGPIPVSGGQEMMAYDLDEIRGLGAIVRSWYDEQEHKQESLSSWK